MPVLRAHYHILLLGNLVTMQVLIDFRLSYFVGFWTAGCAKYFFCATGGISSFFIYTWILLHNSSDKNNRKV